MGLFKDSIGRLMHGPSRNVFLYLDERGTPATDPLFVTGGVLIYDDLARVGTEWKRFCDHASLGRKKGRDLKPSELLDVAAFLIQQPILPIATWSFLSGEETQRLQEFAKKYEKSGSQAKKFSKIAGSNWLWKFQMTHTVACAEAACLAEIGGIQSATVCIDEIDLFSVTSLQKAKKSRRKESLHHGYAAGWEWIRGKS